MCAFIYHFNSSYSTRETHFFSLLVLLTVEKIIYILNLCSESMSVFVFVIYKPWFTNKVEHISCRGILPLVWPLFWSKSRSAHNILRASKIFLNYRKEIFMWAGILWRTGSQITFSALKANVNRRSSTSFSRGSFVLTTTLILCKYSHWLFFFYFFNFNVLM